MNNFKPKTLFLGKNMIYLPSCHSTNDIASEIIQNKEAFDGTIVITDNQTAGRGQRGNAWEAQANQNITTSIILKPEFLKPNEQFKLNIAVSLAIIEFLSGYINLENTQNSLKIKWPNDIYIGNKKMGGILIENTISSSRINHSIIGIGLNINQLQFDNPKASSLRVETTSEEYFIPRLIEELCRFLEKYYFQLKTGQSVEQKKKYLSLLFRLNEVHYFIHNKTRIHGKIIGVNEIGMLEIEINETIKTFDLKEISFEI